MFLNCFGQSPPGLFFFSFRLTNLSVFLDSEFFVSVVCLCFCETLKNKQRFGEITKIEIFFPGVHFPRGFGMISEQMK